MTLNQDQVKQIVMRILNDFEDVPGFTPVKKILIRPFFVDSEKTHEMMVTLVPIRFSPNQYRFRECSDIFIFDVLLRYMPRKEKTRHRTPLFDVLKTLVARHQRLVSANSCTSCSYNASIFAEFYFKEEVFRRANDKGTSGELVRFVEYVMGTVPVKLGYCLRFIGPIALDYLLSCFSDERFHAYDIRERNLLMNKWPDYDMCAIFIRHGFKYSFKQDYYKNCGWNLNKNCSVREGQPIILLDTFEESGNLRMQMAADILVHLLCNGYLIVTRELLCALWESLPDPFITPDELYHLMEPCFLRTSVLEDACARYHEQFPRVPLVKQPRSLKHLARVRIRKSMFRAHSIGEKAVRSLGLPKTLQKYLF